MGENANCRSALYRTLYHHYHRHHSYCNLLLDHLINPVCKRKCGHYFITKSPYKLLEVLFLFFFFFFYKQGTNEDASCPPSLLLYPHLLFPSFTSFHQFKAIILPPPSSLSPQWLLILSTKIQDSPDFLEHYQTEYILSQYWMYWCVLCIVHLDYDTW